MDRRAWMALRATAAPTQSELSAVVEAIAADLGLLIPPRAPGEVEPDDAHQVLELASLMNRSAFGPAWSPGGRRKRGAHLPRRHGAGLEASSGWTSLHAGVRIAGPDRAGLERLCRYVLRPALALSRLNLVGDSVRLNLRHGWDDGTQAVEFTAEEFVGRLAAQVPPKGQHLIRPARMRLAHTGPSGAMGSSHQRPRGARRSCLCLVAAPRFPRSTRLVLAGGGEVLAWLDDEQSQHRGQLLGARARGDLAGRVAPVS